MTHELPLVGAGGEPVDLRRTLASHGVATLPPNVVDDESRTLRVTLPSGRATVREGPPGHAAVEVAGDDEAVLATLRHMLRLDEDLSPFYALAAGDPELAWATRGAGRLLRSPTVFEDVVKTICTTNCAWSGTVRMVGALVHDLGGGTFPSPERMAAAPESFYRDVARAGYRAAYLRSLAQEVAAGRLDLERLADPALGDEEVAARLLALPGVGPYATAHAMMLLGRYGRLVLDSWTRPTYARLAGARRPPKDSAIERRFRRYGPYAGLAFWLFLTRSWVPEADAATA